MHLFVVFVRLLQLPHRAERSESLDPYRPRDLAPLRYSARSEFVGADDSNDQSLQVFLIRSGCYRDADLNSVPGHLFLALLEQMRAEGYQLLLATLRESKTAIPFRPDADSFEAMAEHSPSKLSLMMWQY